ncbi:PX domain-containing protein [Metarhizium rileyi]|uniref:PX domain-containing protein n=1 Tax=Metarhizium rileyi (strain RCEF 4871) TaxID=1649241 RepID=A0A162JBK5_METRR|nr:PX domain-containing protein [Metarhizium rileyi RCEF 4871]TWU79155.1 hypothetical protein ED733_008850 [Metarhizium rileyi]
MSSTTSDGVCQHAVPVEPTSQLQARNRETTSESDGYAQVKPDPRRQNVAPASTSEPAELEVKTSALAAQGLQFISEATPTTLAGIAVALSAILYAILGRVGLVLIGAVGGVLVYISLELRNPAIAQAMRGEKGPEVLDRVWLDLTQCKREDCSHHGEHEDAAIRSFDDFRPETRDALGGLVDAVIRDYVKWWYSPIIPADHSFPLACRKTLNSYLLSVSNRMTRKRPADVFLDLLTNSSSIVIALLSELAAAFAELPPETNMTAADAVYNYLASNPESRLANLLNQKQQAAKFRMVAEDLLGFLDQGSQNCDPARIFLREILANSILETTLQTCSKAEWINGWIVYLLEAGEPDINQAIDVGMQTGRDSGSNAFADIDGNVGNIGIAKPLAPRPNTEMDRSRRKESLGHKKKLSRADEELEEALEERKRMNAMIARGDGQQSDDASLDRTDKPNEGEKLASENLENTQKSPEIPKESAAPRRSRENSPLGGTSTDGFSTKSEAENTPLTPKSGPESSSQPPSPQRSGGQHFTSFDQIVPAAQSEDNEEDGPRKSPLTLHNASFTLHDDATGDSGKIRSKPNWDYLIQVEPSSVAHTGWMIVRRYSDFETLHEILRRIATISGATAFTELHKELPGWKMHTRESLRGELERYLRDGCWYQSLAESEGMKRFLEKSQGHTHGSSKPFGWETVGKNMLDVLSTAPKGAVVGGKTLVGGVSGVFGNIAGLTRKPTSQSVDLTPSVNRLSISTSPRVDSARSPARSDRASMDSQRSSIIATQPGKMAPMSRRPSSQSVGDVDGDLGRMGRGAEIIEPDSGPASARPSMEHSRASSLAALRSSSTVSLDFAKLPPPPDEMTSDYESSVNGEETQPRINEAQFPQSIRGLPSSSSVPSLPTLGGGKKTITKQVKQYSQMSEQETRVAVELLFAVINEMYTLSSAWNIRRTLLAAAKSFLLRPGNPSLLTVQSLIQSSVLDANTSDSGIAAQLRKLRENTMPTDQERATWPEGMTADEKEKLAIKARKLLIQSGVPAALMGVMGQAATGEALGRVFDCLQIEEVARGLIFGLMLQAVRILTH